MSILTREAQNALLGRKKTLDEQIEYDAVTFTLFALNPKDVQIDVDYPGSRKTYNNLNGTAAAVEFNRQISPSETSIMHQGRHEVYSRNGSALFGRHYYTFKFTKCQDGAGGMYAPQPDSFEKIITVSYTT